MVKMLYLHSLLLLLATANLNAQNSKTDSLFRLLEKSAEDTNRVMLYGNLSGTLRLTDPAKAIAYGQKGILLARKLAFNKGIAACYLNVSTAYIYSDKLDTALTYLDTALQYAHVVKDPNRLGLAYLNRADIYRQMQNFSQSLKDCETALGYADQANNDDVRARINQTIGAVYYQQNIYPQSISYYDKAILLYRKTGNLRMTATVLNNLGLIYKSTGDFTRSVAVTTGAIRITDSLKDVTNLSIFNGNLSDIYFQMGHYGQAEQFANKAMEYAQQQQNEKLMAIAWTFLGNIYIRQKRFTEATVAGNKALTIFIKIDDTDRINTAADMLAEAYALSGDYAKAYENMLISKSANDSLVKWRYDDDIAAMQTKFKLNEKDKEILLLAKDKELQDQKLERQRLLITATTLFALLAVGGLWLLRNRHLLRQKMKELEIRNQIAADLHDEVGSSLSSIQMLSQIATGQTSIDSKQKEILTKMSTNAKETMEKMVDIVWMIKSGETEEGSLKQRMERFAYEICGNKNIETNLQLEDFEKLKLTMKQRKNIYLFFKEALNNAVKYSGTEKIAVSATVENKKMTLLVKDHGKGFDNSTTNRGNGLDNMKNRALELNGILEIHSETGEGTSLALIISV